MAQNHERYFHRVKEQSSLESSVSICYLLRALPASLCFLMFMLIAGPGHAAEPGKVTVGAYVTKVQDVSFRDNRYTIDFYLWFRWKAEGPLADFKPLDTFELINGRIDTRGSVVEKKIGNESYATVRVSATMAENWDLKKFPFDSHRLYVNIEDAALFSSDMVYVADTNNSRLGDEIDMGGWSVSNFEAKVLPKVYKSNYGDTSLPTDSLSEYSRFSMGMDMTRTSFGSAWKLLTTVLAATAVAFVAFMVKPTDLDPRFGLGVGALFAVAASAFVASSAVPDSGVMTAADQVHMIAIGFIFTSVLQSALALKLEVSGQVERATRFDHMSLLIFPLLFFGTSGWIIYRAMH